MVIINRLQPFDCKTIGLLLLHVSIKLLMNKCPSLYACIVFPVGHLILLFVDRFDKVGRSAAKLAFEHVRSY
jgi:hypothetical protein